MWKLFVTVMMLQAGSQNSGPVLEMASGAYTSKSNCEATIGSLGRALIDRGFTTKDARVFLDLPYGVGLECREMPNQEVRY